MFILLNRTSSFNIQSNICDSFNDDPVLLFQSINQSFSAQSSYKELM